MTSRRLQFGVAIIDDRLYVVGGREGLKTLNTVECYDPATRCWSCQPPMNNHRHGLGTLWQGAASVWEGMGREGREGGREGGKENG